MSPIRIVPILALIATLGAPLAGVAQTPAPSAVAPSPLARPHRGHHHRERFIHALRSLNLTPAQQQQVAAFRDGEKRANLNADAATRASNAAKMRDQIMRILTAGQKTQLAAELHRWHARVKPAGSIPNSAPSPGSN